MQNNWFCVIFHDKNMNILDDMIYEDTSKNMDELYKSLEDIMKEEDIRTNKY